MEQGEIDKNPAFLKEVYQLNEGRAIQEALEISWQELNALDLAQLQRIGQQSYAPQKWTLHQILQHLIDWERIWCFRAVIFARREGTIPVAHDQEIMAHHSNANELPLAQLVEELRIVRQSTIMLFRSFNPEILNMTCRFFEYEMPLHAIGLSITAHQIHHFKVIRERYLPLDPGA